MFFPFLKLFSSTCHSSLKKTAHQALANYICAFILQTVHICISQLLFLQTTTIFLANYNLANCNYFSCKLSSCKLLTIFFFFQTIILQTVILQIVTSFFANCHLANCYLTFSFSTLGRAIRFHCSWCGGRSEELLFG